MRALFVTADGALRAPWRIALFFGATFVAGALVSSIAYGLLSLTPLVGLARSWRVPLDQLGALSALLIGTWLALCVDGGGVADWAQVGLARAAWRARTALVGLAAGALGILVPSALLLAAHRYAFEAQPHTTTWLGCAGTALLLLAPAALVEELAMRGYLLAALRASYGATAAVAVTSLCFALLHLFNPNPTVLSTTTVAIAGVFLAAVRLATGSLVAAWMAHLAWNFAQAAILHAPVSGLPLGASDYRLLDLGPAWLTGGSWGPEGGVAAAVGMVVATLLVVRGSRAGGGYALSVLPVENDA
ncbi:MAG: CPBP family intramembrane metalloprotease [Gemmatimonadetes bacterium]|nr:CPBP family intramembrane metalloprotease [Gemmatimonadota bacterium]